MSDFSQVHALGRDLSGLSQAKVLAQTRAVMARAALNVKNQLRDEANDSGIAEAKALARFVRYDTKVTHNGVTAVVGPIEGNAGSFAFLYFGNAKNGPVLPDPGNAMKDEVPNLLKYLGEIGSDVL